MFLLAYLTAINTVGVLAHRIDVVAYEISVLIEARSGCR